MSVSTQVMFFDNLGALEAHLQWLLGSCKKSSEKCREALGNLLRERQGQKEEEQWSQQISQALSGNTAGPAEKDAKEKKGGMFGSKQKGSMLGDKPKKEKGSMFGGGKPKAQTDWVSFDPFAVFVGQESKGMAELYFEAINSLDESAKRIELALATLATLKGKAAAAGNVSAVVSFINGVPAKVMLKPAQEGRSKKKKIEYSFSVPVARPALPRVLPL
ncbi:MAG: hypothetical protein QXJ74_01455 [Nitrososphaera sp.]